MSGPDLSPRPAKRPRTATYSNNRTILSSSPSTRTSGRRSRATSAFSDSDRTLVRPDGNVEDQNGTYLNSEPERTGGDVVEEVEEPNGERTGGEEQAVPTRRGGRRKVPTPKALAAKEQTGSARQLRRRTKQAPQAAHNDFDDENDENDNNDNDDSNNDQHNSPEPDDYAGTPTRSDKKRPACSTVVEVTAEQSPKPKRGRKPGTALKTASPQPKGILTPSRRRRNGPAKSVVFSSSRTSEKEIEEQLGFRDIDTAVTRKDKPDGTDEPSTELGATDSISSIDNVDSVDNIFVDPNPPPDILSGLSLCEPTDSAVIQHQTTPDSPSVAAIRQHIIQRLTSSSRPADSLSLIPPHLSSVYSTLSTLLISTITTSESNSLLLLGARGSGKSLLINTALSTLSHQHANDFHVVRLNGFLQTDDRLALREIWRQLGRERAVDEEETGQVMSSYADTMASLLGLLSHPDEIGPAPDAMDIDNTWPTTASKSVIIVIDEFDLFTTHPRQTLLYNLFDIAQSRKAPIAVIGCSTRMDVVDCLEKRVKSRFSHRWVHVPTAKTLAAFTECIQTVLCISDDEVVADVDEADRQQWNQAVRDDLLTRPLVSALLNRTFYSTKSPADVLTKLYLPVATLSLHHSASPPPTTLAPSHAAPSLRSLLLTLPPLHLGLLIAASRLDSIYLAPAVNFNAVFTHYSLLHRHTRLKLATASSSFRLWSKAACKSAWEDLLRWKFLVVSGGGPGARDEKGDGGVVSDDVRWCRVEITLDEIDAALAHKRGSKSGSATAGSATPSTSIGGVDEVLARWCQEETVAW